MTENSRMTREITTYAIISVMSKQLSIKDSLSKRSVLIDLSKEIKIYVCGPTIYDYCHMGHARSFIVFDALRRSMAQFTKVIFVQNITDIAEKITERAEKENVSEEEIIKKYVNFYQKDCQLLNIKKPDFEPRPSDYIDEITSFIQALLYNKKAYVKDDGIYFEAKTVNYGKFEQRCCENEDFALWKFRNTGRYFKSDIGDGIPGWHIECSAMASSLLGTDIDIHGGGLDLKFPHHENEIAQWEGLVKHNVVSAWMHSGLVNINGIKMSKSLQNYWYVKDFIQNTFEADSFRYFVLSHHYRSDIEITEQKIQQAQETMKNIRIYYFQHMGRVNKNHRNTNLLEKLLDDFDTSYTLSLLGGLIENDKIDDLHYVLHTLGFHMQIITEISQLKIQQLIEERKKAKAAKNFQISDDIRNFLLKNYVGIKDHKDHTEWFYL